MRPPPRGSHAVRDIIRVAQGRSAAWTAVGTSVAALPAVAHQVVGAGARMPGGLILRDAIPNDGLSDRVSTPFG